MEGYSVKICKARTTDPAKPTPEGAILIQNELPDEVRWKSLPEWERYADGEARAIECVLRDCLPGGVYDRLLGHMLAHKASHLQVAHGRK